MFPDSEIPVTEFNNLLNQNYNQIYKHTQGWMKIVKDKLFYDDIFILADVIFKSYKHETTTAVRQYLVTMFQYDTRISALGIKGN